MKMAIVVVGVLVLIWSNVYAQTQVAPAPISNRFDVYKVTLRGTDQMTNDFLKTVNYSEETYQDTFVGKMGEGAINAATSWTDVPGQMAQVSEEHNILLGCTLGLGEGLVSGIIRGVSGAYDIATCGLPPYDEPTVKPKYKVNDPQKEGFKVKLLSW